MRGQASKNAFALSSNIPSVIKELQVVLLRMDPISRNRDTQRAQSSLMWIYP